MLHCKWLQCYNVIAFITYATSHFIFLYHESSVSEILKFDFH